MTEDQNVDHQDVIPRLRNERDTALLRAESLKDTLNAEIRLRRLRTEERDTARAELARLKYRLADLRDEVPQLKRAIIELSVELQEVKAKNQRLLADT